MNHSKKQKLDTLPYRNRSPYNWYIGSYIERFEYYDEKKQNLNRRCLSWENTVIVIAKNRDEAFKKICDIGKCGQGKSSESWNEKGRKGQWHFEGLTSLIPIYDALEDGAEILWVEHRRKTVRKIKSMIKTKKELEVFKDQ